MKWFHFSQNNSGGSFVVTSELCHHLFIEAANDIAALAKAFDMGVYLHGVRDGLDCGCCGDRWYEPSEEKFPLFYDGKGGVVFKGPEEYAQHLANDFGWTSPDARIYYADGRVVEIHGKVRGKK